MMHNMQESGIDMYLLLTDGHMESQVIYSQQTITITPFLSVVCIYCRLIVPRENVVLRQQYDITICVPWT